MNPLSHSTSKRKTKWILVGSLALTAGALGFGLWLKERSSSMAPPEAAIQSTSGAKLEVKPMEEGPAVAPVASTPDESSRESQSIGSASAGSANVARSEKPENDTQTPAAVQPGSRVAESKEALKPQVASCYEVTYESDKKDLSAYSRNLVRLPVSEFNAKSVCIKVNGTPVKFVANKNKKNEFIIGAMNRSNSKITVRYCQETAQCKESCVVPKDEFFEALAGEEDLSHPEQVAQGFGESETDQKVERELAAFKDDLNGADQEKGQFYAEWKNTAPVPACTTRVASK